MIIGFIGLGNLGEKLAATLLRNGMDLIIHDKFKKIGSKLITSGAKWEDKPVDLAKKSDIIITCLPSPTICAEVMESETGVIEGLSEGKIWLEMSTTSKSEVLRLSTLVSEKGGYSADCPVSGGCHKAVTGNISIFAGCDREVFEKIKSILFIMGKKVLHTGNIGTASVLKVMTNYLATANLVSCCEALTTMKGEGLDLAKTFQAIKISSGNSFVHETESQVILNGSRNINFTMDLVLKDVEIFQKVADEKKIPLEIAPKLIEIFKDGISTYGNRAFSPSIIERLEDKTGLQIICDGFPENVEDEDDEVLGYEV